MKKTNPNDFAYTNAPYNETKEFDNYEHYGLTKRELFAAMAMQGITADSSSHITVKECAELSVQMADALISQLNQETKEL